MLILVSGPIGAGKTTLCWRLADRARECGLRVAGVLAPALMEQGFKVGIQALDLGSLDVRLLARVDRDLGGTRVGPYSFDDRVLDWVVGSCERALTECRHGVVFVDEIGKLELNRRGGLAQLIPLLERPREQTTVIIVRDALLDSLVERLCASKPRVVWVDGACREQAWREIAELVLGGECAEAGRC